MQIDKDRRSALVSWAIVAALFVLCGALGVLQYRWIGEVSVAWRERLQASVEASLSRISREFNAELASAATAVLPASPPENAAAAESEIAERYKEAKGGRAGQLFRRIAIAEPYKGGVVLRTLNFEKGEFETASWPDDWASLRERTEARILPRNGTQAPGPPMFDNRSGEEGAVFEMPVLGSGGTPGSPGGPGGPFGREVGWLMMELNLPYVRERVLPELVQRNLEVAGSLAYQVEVVTRANPPAIIYQSDAALGRISKADASVGLGDLQLDFRRFSTGGRRGGGRGANFGPGGTVPGNRAEPGRGPGRGGPAGAEFGRWEMRVRSRAGSLEAVVARTRWRTLTVNFGVLLLLIAAVAALVSFTRRSQKLAELQMQFVAGVSHELRTPLTVIYTAGYSLQGKMAQNPAQVVKYGTLIQKESGRLKDLVEEVLRFARASAGHAIQEPEPLSIEGVIDESIESSKAAVEGAQCVLERNIPSDLPVIMGDPMALKHAIENLVTNAAKYGARGGNWIGVSASTAGTPESPAVEIRVADRGPGIPRDEQAHVFEPFYRGRSAVEGQVHGTGLGLNLVKKIVEAHGGSIRVKSEPAKGTEFVMRLPAVPAGALR